ncbi:MAG TPA: hypothetical protein VGI36_20195 [Candidatus Binataceae bacterium]
MAKEQTLTAWVEDEVLHIMLDGKEWSIALDFRGETDPDDAAFFLTDLGRALEQKSGTG